MDELKKLIREIPDYPKPGILFYDLTTLLQDPAGFHSLVDQLCEQLQRQQGGHRRGHRGARLYFRAGAGVPAGCGFCPRAQAEEAAGEDRFGDVSARIWHGPIRNSQDAIQAGQPVLICDDLLATGGTAVATVNLIDQAGRQSGRRSLRRGTNFPQWPREIPRSRCIFAA